jgi:hypothetical protein
MGCDPLIFHNITPDVISCIRTELERLGVNLPPGNNGVISNYGIKADYNWSPAEQILSIIIKSKPFFIPCAVLIGRIQDNVKACRARSHPETG